MDLKTVKEWAGPRQFAPKDDMPEEYRKATTWMIQFHVNSGVMGGYLEKPFIRQTPSTDRKLAFSAKVQDEISHARLLYRAAESPGIKTCDEMLDELARGDSEFLNYFHYPTESWHEVSMITLLVDGAAMHRQATLKNTSRTPYVHAMDKVCLKEGFHVRHDESILSELMGGSKATQEKTQTAFEMWWPHIIQFFGLTNDESVHNDPMQEVGLKMRSNDELRNTFLDTYVPKAEKYDLVVPEYPCIEYDEEPDTYHVNEDNLNWDEFWTIVENASDGSHEQINSCAKAQVAIGWVRESTHSWEDASGAETPQAAD